MFAKVARAAKKKSREKGAEDNWNENEDT